MRRRPFYDLAVEGQEDFSAGAFPLQEQMPATAVQDCVNGIYDDDGSLFKRGGGAYVGPPTPYVISSSPVAGAPLFVWDAWLGSGYRFTFVGTYDATATELWHLTDTWSSSNTAVLLATLDRAAIQRLVVFNGMIVAIVAIDPIFLYAGALTSIAGLSVGALTFTFGSPVVKCPAGGLTGHVIPGEILDSEDAFGARDGYPTPVASVDSDTQVTLVAPWLGPDGSHAGSFSYRYTVAAPPSIKASTNQTFVAVAGGRLWMARGNKIAFTPTGRIAHFEDTDLHELPEGALITGLQPLEDRLVVFTTFGVWEITNVALDLTDDFGNAQQQIVKMASDVVLWGDAGIAGQDGSVFVPALDDVYTLNRGGVHRMAGAAGIRKLWQQYVKSGYRPGVAAVHRGHYFLPILNDAAWVDTLVCKLSTGAWSRWSGYCGQCRGFAQRIDDVARTPKLLGAGPDHVVDLTGAFDPTAANKQDPDGSTHTLQVVLRPFVRRAALPEVWRYLRARYELVDAAVDHPTVLAEAAKGSAGAWVSVTAFPVDSGDRPKRFTVNKRAQLLRVRLTSSGPSQSLVLRSAEAMVRNSYRQ